MSMNAEPIRANAQIPSWSKIVSVLIERLYPENVGFEDIRVRLRPTISATSVALRLAEEYAAAFGRAALDDLLLELIPDQHVKPGKLHELLISLPWAEVLTTNYDTLLERAAENLETRKYSIVRTPAEIFSSNRPRIVKLHGSFPSNRPFIISEEDFRTYHNENAPFVNLVQQTLMENMLCLIGFSGDDVNFLTWSGWVRDQLGRHAPRIYLCGLLDLTDSQRLLLESRGVIPIDLNPLFDEGPGEQGLERHKRALLWFLHNLSDTHYDPRNWPDPPVRTEYPHVLPDILASSTVFPTKEPAYPKR